MTARSLFRVLRWVGLAAVAPALWACNARSLEQPILKPEQTYGKTFQQSINRNVDLLFMVDNSSSMRLSQNNLRTNFPQFMTRLADPPGLPNVHIAVVTSDMGAGDGSISGCAAQPGNGYAGNNGIFQYAGNIIPPATTACTTGLDSGATYISDIGGVRNYTGNLPDVFTCMAAVGEGGCGFEHQFASILRALGADGLGPPPAENQGFLRPDAYLVVILITNEDDCSVPPGVQLFDTTVNNNLMTQLGPPANFRCNEFGHLCTMGGGAPMHPSRLAPGNDVNATVMYDSCTSNDTEGFLLGAKDTAAKLKALKTDPSMVLVAAITGAPTPYTVHWAPPKITDMSCGIASCPWPEITHSCVAQDTSFADPGVRIKEFVDQFGGNGLTLSICDNSFGPSLDNIATLINQSLKPPCITQQIANKPGTSDPDCTVISHTSNGMGGYIDSPVDSCAKNGNQKPCWQFINNATGCNPGNIVDPMMLMDPNVSMSTSQNATVNCALCTAGVTDAARGCP